MFAQNYQQPLEHPNVGDISSTEIWCLKDIRLEVDRVLGPEPNESSDSEGDGVEITWGWLQFEQKGGGVVGPEKSEMERSGSDGCTGGGEWGWSVPGCSASVVDRIGLTRLSLSGINASKVSSVLFRNIRIKSPWM